MYDPLTTTIFTAPFLISSI